MVQGVDHILNTLVVADVICITGVDDSTDTCVDDLFKVRAAAPHPVPCHHEMG